MNFFPFHLGDYAAHTAHLDLLEDLAYRRMLDLYYRTEQPLPSDWRQIARLIRMKDQGAEIEAVLSEFFVLTDDGWRHGRCDREIERMQDKQAKAKASAQASVNARSANAKRTLSERSADVELPIPIPIPIPRPTPNKERALAQPEVEKPTAAGAICKAMKAAGLSAVNPGDPRLLALLEQGATESEFVGIAGEAVEKGKGWAWVLHVLQARRSDAAAISLAPPPTDPTAWRHDDRSLRAMAAQLGVASRPDERIDGWQRRIVTAWQRAGQPALRQEQAA